MYRKLSIPVGVAVLAALALVGMLGIFAFNAAQPAQAAGVSNLMVEVSNSGAGATGVDYTFEFTTTEQLEPTNFIEITIPDGFPNSDFTGRSDTQDATLAVGTADAMALEATLADPGVYSVPVNVRIASGMMVTVVLTGLTNPATATTGNWMVDTDFGSADVQSAMVTIGDMGDGMNGNGDGTTPMPGDYSVSARPVDPGEPAQITLKFMNPTDLDIDQFITFVVEDDMGVPSTINPNTVSITGMGTEDSSSQTAAPNGVIVEEDTDAETYEITVFIGDMSTAADEATEDGLAAGAVTVVFRQNAGFTNRTEGGTDDWSFFTATTGSSSSTTEIGSYTVPFLVELSSYKDGRGEEIIAFAYGFKNGTTVRFWRDQNGDGVIDTNEPDLCNATASGDDIAECSFTLANPPFVGGHGRMDTARGVNYINAVDGRGNTGTPSRLHMLELEPSITITPKQGAPGDSINVQVLDLEEDDRIAWIRLARRDALCGSSAEDSDDADSCAGFFDTGSNSAGANGVLSFSFEIPSSVDGRAISPGIQDLRVDTVGGKDANTNIAIATGELQLSSTDVLPNQRVSISASGFTKSSNNTGDRAAWFGGKRPDSLGADDHECSGQTMQGSVKLGGQDIPWNRINDGDGIEVTSGGTWSAPLDFPVNRTTTVAGTYELRIVDCRGGIATVDLTFPQREVTLSPEEGGVGSEVVISGKNFPVENDHSPTKAYEVQVIYDADVEEEEDDVDPNAVGSFTIILEVPEDATIPSNNTVSVEFTDDNRAPVLETFTHRIPQGTISFDRNTGPENSVLTVEAKGFARYTSMDKVEFGDRDILPIPKPSTDTNGNGEFQIRIPGADPGIFIIRVEIADVVATHTFTVTEGGGAEDAEVETVLGNIMSEDALDRIFRFDNTTKMWEWYISDPAFASTNNLAGLSSGDLVYIKVTKDVTADVLGASVTLTCTNAGTDTEDCWNLIAIP